MPLYHATIPGRRKPLLIKAENATKAFASLITLTALTAAEKDDALEAGEKIWKPGTDLPDDEPPVGISGEASLGAPGDPPAAAAEQTDPPPLDPGQDAGDLDPPSSEAGKGKAGK